MLHHPVEDDDIREIKVMQVRERPKAPLLASPTTPFHFEATRPSSRCYYQESPAAAAQFEEATSRIQRTIQLQLLNYIDTSRIHQQQQSHAFLQQHQQQQQQQHHHQQLSTMSHAFLQPAAEQHSSIALLQQRFQRLERDKEMRQVKQLHHGSCTLESSLLEDSSSPRKSPFHAENRPVLAATGSTTPPGFADAAAACNRDVMFCRGDFPAAAAAATTHQGKMLLPESSQPFRFSSTEAPYDRRPPRETQFLLKNWSSASEKSYSCIRSPEENGATADAAAAAAAADSDELDTSLHL